MSTRFFWERFQRAVTMDATNKERGLHTPFTREAVEWMDAFKQTLSNNKLRDFDKEWAKYDEELEDARHLADFGKPRKKKK